MMTSIVRTFVVAFLLMLALLGAAALGYAQARSGTSPVPPLVLSGTDIGFRLEGRKGTSVVGRFVVRIDGQWVDVDYTFGPKVVTTGH
jgi:hypothetical protein